MVDGSLLAAPAIAEPWNLASSVPVPMRSRNDAAERPIRVNEMRG
jgi:hypothetical protein